MRVLLLGVLCLVLVGCVAGCATPEVRIPVGAAAIGYANGVGMYATGRMMAIQMRRDGKIDDGAWEELKAMDMKAHLLKTEVEKALLDARAPVDWEKVMAYTNSSVELLMKLGVLVAK